MPQMGHKWGQVVMTTTQKPTKEAVIKARCDSGLKRAVDQIAMLQQLDSSDIVRIAVAAYVQKFQTGSFQRG